MTARTLYLPGLPFADAPTLEEHVEQETPVDLDVERYQRAVRDLRAERGQ